MKIKEQFKSFIHFYFDNDESEKKIDSPTCEEPNVTRIKVIIDNEVDNFDSLFYQCSIISKINFIEFEITNIKSMKSMFQSRNKKK